MHEADIARMVEDLKRSETVEQLEDFMERNVNPLHGPKPFERRKSQRITSWRSTAWDVTKGVAVATYWWGCAAAIMTTGILWGWVEAGMVFVLLALVSAVGAAVMHGLTVGE